MSVRRAAVHVTVQPVNAASPGVSHGDRLKALESYIPKRKAAVGAVAPREHVVRIGASLKETVMKQMGTATIETDSISPDEAAQWWKVTELKEKIKGFLEDGKFTAIELTEVLENVAAVQGALLDDMEVCQARLAQSEARLAQYSQKLADESFEDYSPYDTYDTYEPYKPRPNNVRLMRVVVGMLAAGGTLMAAVQSAETTNPGQGFDVAPLPNLPWSVQQQSLGASVA